MQDYNAKQRCPNCRRTKTVHRNYEEDQTHSHYVHGLHECKTVGHYADKQTKMYGKEKTASMLESFKTKKDPESGMKELPTGMSRAKTAQNLPSNLTKSEAKRKRKKK